MTTNKFLEKSKKIIELVVFLSIVLILFCKLTWLFRSNSGEAREDIQGFKNQGEVDVVLYGGSNLLRYYEPLEAYHIKGFTSYNYATTAYTADLLKYFIEESRVSNEAALYVCDIRTILPAGEVSEELSLRTWSDSVEVFSPARIKGITSYLSKRDWDKSDLFSFYFDIGEYHTNYDALGNTYQWRFMDLEGIYNMDKGFNAKHSTGHIPFDRPAVTDTRAELTGRQAETLNELLNYCDEEKLPVLFIVCPYIISETEWEVFNACGDFIQERGYDFVNFNLYYDEIGFDFETDFFDVNHINYLGAEKYTAYLMNYLADHYDLPDHRGDTEYFRWDEDYAEYAFLQKEWKESIAEVVEGHLEAKRTGENLKNINDFSEWFSAVQNENFTVIAVNNQYDIPASDLALNMILNGWGIDKAGTVYIGGWQEEDNTFSYYDSDSFDGEIGVDGGRGTVSCNVILDEVPRILVNGADYGGSREGILMVVFDNNYHRVVDHVNVYADENGAHLLRD